MQFSLGGFDSIKSQSTGTSANLPFINNSGVYSVTIENNFVYLNQSNIQGNIDYSIQLVGRCTLAENPQKFYQFSASMNSLNFEKTDFSNIYRNFLFITNSSSGGQLALPPMNLVTSKSNKSYTTIPFFNNKELILGLKRKDKERLNGAANFSVASVFNLDRRSAVEILNQQEQAQHFVAAVNNLKSENLPDLYIVNNVACTLQNGSYISVLDGSVQTPPQKQQNSNFGGLNNQNMMNMNVVNNAQQGNLYQQNNQQANAQNPYLNQNNQNSNFENDELEFKA